MIFEAHIVCRKNADRILEEYKAMFPERMIPDRRYFLILYRKFRSNEKCFAKSKSKKTFVVDEETEINMLAYFEANRENSIQDCLRDRGLCFGTIQRILKKT